MRIEPLTYDTEFPTRVCSVIIELQEADHQDFNCFFNHSKTHELQTWIRQSHDDVVVFACDYVLSRKTRMFRSSLMSCIVMPVLTVVGCFFPASSLWHKILIETHLLNFFMKSVSNVNVSVYISAPDGNMIIC